MQFKTKLILSKLPVILVLAFLTGCHSIINIPEVPIEYSHKDKINLKVKLYLSEELLNSRWGEDASSYVEVPIGETLSNNSKILLNEIFTEVVVSKDLNDAGEVIATFTPRVVMIKQTFPLWGFGDMETTIMYEWMLKDKSNNIIWADTITARHKGPWDSGRPKKNGLIQFNALMNELFQKSFNSISSSQEIKEFAAKKY